MCRSPSETWMFSVVFWILCSWLPCLCLANWQVSCSRYVVQLQQNICHQNDCEHEDRALSPRRGPEGASRTLWGEMNIISQIARYFAWQHLVYQAGNLEFNSSSDRQPMKLTQYRCDVFTTFRSCDQPCHSILHRLYLPHEFVGHSVQQRVAVVQATWNERLY